MRAWIAALLLAACGGVAERAIVVAHPEPVRLRALEPVLAPGVAAVDAGCAEGAEERCDALDSDCDGRIDEGCEGATLAPLEIAIAWNGPASVELALGVPGEPEPLTSGASCGESPRIARLSRRELVAGVHRVEVVHADACGSEAPVTASVTLAIEGRVLGTFNRALSPGERAAWLELELVPLSP